MWSRPHTWLPTLRRGVSARCPRRPCGGSPSGRGAGWRGSRATRRQCASRSRPLLLSFLLQCLAEHGPCPLGDGDASVLGELADPFLLLAADPDVEAGSLPVSLPVV